VVRVIADVRTQQMRRPLLQASKIAALAAAVPALAVGGAMFYIAGEHNPQQVFHGGVNSSLSAWLLVGVSWFVPVFIVVFVLAFLLLWLVLRFGRLSSNNALHSDARDASRFNNSPEPRAGERGR
jgi:hypothetical protein